MNEKNIALEKLREKRIPKLARNPHLGFTVDKGIAIDIVKHRQKAGVSKNSTYIKQAIVLLMLLDTVFDNDDKLIISTKNGKQKIECTLRSLLGR